MTKEYLIEIETINEEPCVGKQSKVKQKHQAKGPWITSFT